MKGYKAFKPGFYCEHGGNKKQYFENSIAEDTGANGCCRQGVMHFCEAPLDTLDYHPLIDDGETLKPDTWYTLKDGEFVEAER